MPEFKCTRCGVQYRRGRRLKDPGRQRPFCSLACYHAQRIKPVELRCDACGKIFKRYKSQAKSAKAFCTRECLQTTQNGCMHDAGYRLVTVDGVQDLEHRVVMARILGRPLSKDEIVHHVNENKLDNRPDNLQIMTRAEHMRHHNIRPHG